MLPLFVALLSALGFFFFGELFYLLLVRLDHVDSALLVFRIGFKVRVRAWTPRA